MCETRDLGIKWPHWHTIIFSNDTKIDMRFVCPKDVKKMLVQRARSVYWKKWAAKHENEELKEGAEDADLWIKIWEELHGLAEEADELAKAGATLDEGYMAEAKAETMQQEREEVYAALRYAASFHCLVEQWKDCEELRPKPKEKWFSWKRRARICSSEQSGVRKHINIGA